MRRLSLDTFKSRMSRASDSIRDEVRDWFRSLNDRDEDSPVPNEVLDLGTGVRVPSTTRGPNQDAEALQQMGAPGQFEGRVPSRPGLAGEAPEEQSPTDLSGQYRRTPSTVTRSAAAEVEEDWQASRGPREVLAMDASASDHRDSGMRRLPSTVTSSMAAEETPDHRDSGMRRLPSTVTSSMAAEETPDHRDSGMRRLPSTVTSSMAAEETPDHRDSGMRRLPSTVTSSSQDNRFGMRGPGPESDIDWVAELKDVVVVVPRGGLVVDGMVEGRVRDGEGPNVRYVPLSREVSAENLSRDIGPDPEPDLEEEPAASTLSRAPGRTHRQPAEEVLGGSSQPRTTRPRSGVR